MPKENIIETNKRTLDSLSPSDKQKIQNSLNESNK
jgi:hypothetical protein